MKTVKWFVIASVSTIIGVSVASADFVVTQSTTYNPGWTELWPYFTYNYRIEDVINTTPIVFNDFEVYFRKIEEISDYDGPGVKAIEPGPGPGRVIVKSEKDFSTPLEFSRPGHHRQRLPRQHP